MVTERSAQLMSLDRKTRDMPFFLLAAGGTGGHLFPAQALAEALMSRGASVHLLTDIRVRAHVEHSFPGSWGVVHSSPLRFSHPLKCIVALWKIALGVWSSLCCMIRRRPDLVVGFGGYPTIPPLIAAWILRIPIALHEQNSVLGRANRLFLSRAVALATSFPDTVPVSGKQEKHLPMIVNTGNPVRESVQRVKEKPYLPPEVDKAFRILVFGGSQGASFFSEIVPAALADFPPLVRAHFQIFQQVREEEMDRVKSQYAALGVDAKLAPFFLDLPDLMSESHLVISRAGATTIAELKMLGRPALLVPLPSAGEGEQDANARILEREGAAWVIRQVDFSAERLLQFLKGLKENRSLLVNAARIAKTLNEGDAAQNLADLAMGLVGSPKEEGRFK